MPKLSELEGASPSQDSVFLENLGVTPKTKKLSEIPMEPGIEPVGLLESAITPIKAYGAALPVLKGIEKFARPAVSKIASKLLPKTGTQLTGGIATAAGAGVAGELASRAVPEEKKEYKPLARLGGELGFGGLTALTGGVGRGATSTIPKERIEGSKYLQEQGKTPIEIMGKKFNIPQFGASPGYAQLQYGPSGGSSKVRLGAQQGVANRIYNKSLGLPEKEIFGAEEFIAAKNNLNNEYNTLLENKNIKLEPDFFNRLNTLLSQQQKLGESGITFGQSKAILDSLNRIGGIPKKWQQTIKGLSGIADDEATSQDSQKMLAVINDILPSLSNKATFTMAARDYNTIRSILGDAASRTALNRNARVLRQMQNLFDEQADKSLPPEIANRLKQTRLRWEALKTLEEAQLQSGSEPGIISPAAVGSANRKRLEEGSIYGTNNLLKDIGDAGLSLGIKMPGDDIAQLRGLTPRSTMWGLVRDLAGIPLYPLSRYGVARRLDMVPAKESYAVPTAAAEVSRQGLPIQRKEEK